MRTCCIGTVIYVGSSVLFTIIQPEFGNRLWHGRCAEPIDSVDENIVNDEHIKKGASIDEGKRNTKYMS